MAKKKIETVSCTIPLDSAFTHILFNLAAQGYSHIKVEYSGGGDSGAIDYLTLIKRGGVIESDDDYFSLADKAIENPPDDDLRDIIEKKVDDILEEQSDWYNGDGGGGILFICTEDNNYKGDHYYNVVTSEHETIEGKLGD